MIRGELRVVFDHLPRIASGLQPAVDGVIAHELGQARDEARADAPVRTGRLRDSIVVEKIAGGYALVAGVFYAILVELGTRLRPGRPFLLPSFTRAVGRIGHRLPDALARLAR
ncbi:MAG: HK97 gp10 family phage protein [Vicinamibacterales bacterium]